MQPPPEPEEERRTNARPDLLAEQHFPPPPRQERSRRKRDALLQSALVLFAERGYEQTSIEEIAQQASVAVGGFYQHFASKRQILLVLMDRLLQEASLLTLEVKSANLPGIHDGIAHLVRQALQVDWGYVGAYRAWREAAALDREIQGMQHQIEAWTTRQLALLFQALLQVPGARLGVNREILAWEFALLLLRLAETPLAEPDIVVASLTSLIYHSLFTDNMS